MTADFTFDSLVYTRPDYQQIIAQADGLTSKVHSAAFYTDVRQAVDTMETLQQQLSTMTTIAMIRHTLDTRDAYYEEENLFNQTQMPTAMPALLSFNEALKRSPFRKELEEAFGPQFFVHMELQDKTFCEANIPLMQEEAALTSEYQKIMASSDISLRGREYNIYGVQKFFEHEDRALRKEAWQAFSGFLQKHEAEMERIWDRLITLRNQMAKNLGYDNFIPVGYLQQGRTDYGPEEVAAFRRQVREDLVPLCEKLYRMQAERLGVDSLQMYDEKRVFPDGNAVPAGDDDFMIRQARQMYHDMSP